MDNYWKYSLNVFDYTGDTSFNFVYYIILYVYIIKWLFVLINT